MLLSRLLGLATISTKHLKQVIRPIHHQFSHGTTEEYQLPPPGLSIANILQFSHGTTGEHQLPLPDLSIANVLQAIDISQPEDLLQFTTDALPTALTVHIILDQRLCLSISQDLSHILHTEQALQLDLGVHQHLHRLIEKQFTLATDQDLSEDTSHIDQEQRHDHGTLVDTQLDDLIIDQELYAIDQGEDL